MEDLRLIANPYLLANETINNISKILENVISQFLNPDTKFF